MRTYRRWYQEGQIRHDKRAKALRPMPSNKLTSDETAAIIAVCNEPRFASLPPTQIVPTLLDEGIYAVGFFFPVVAQGQARIRTQMSAAHSRAHLDKAIAAFTKVGKDLGVIQ